MASPVQIRRGVNDGVIVGAGAVEADLGRIADRLAASRVVVLTTPSVAKTSLVGTVTDALGDRHAGTYAGSQAHTPRHTVFEAAAAARDAGAEALVSLGGSSVVDMAKGAAMVLAEGSELDRLRLGAGRRLVEPTLPHLAIPTTLSAAEFTAAAGITNTETGVKELFVAATLAPRWVILDPAMTTATPDRLWRGTGMKLVADCLEGLLSPRATEYARSLLTSALTILLRDLGQPASDLDARRRCLEAAHMTLSNLHNVGVGAVAALRHQLGGRCGVAHGEASTIVLPHVMRWNGQAAAPTLDWVATTLEREGAADLIDRIDELIVELELPGRLRDVGVTEADLDPIAEHAAAEASARHNVRPAAESDLRRILTAAW
jgi:alcohol dehydrogenase class IV